METLRARRPMTTPSSTSRSSACVPSGRTTRSPSATTVFASQATRDALVQRFVDRMFGVNVTSQPNFTEVQPILDSLMDDLTTGCTPATCDAERTRTVVKSMCAAALASAAASIH